VLVSVCHGDKIPEENNLKKERCIWILFQKFQSKIGWLHHFGLELRPNITVVGACSEESCLPHGGQGTKKMGPRQDRLFKGTPPVTYFLQ
jgi:hypothetical protein